MKFKYRGPDRTNKRLNHVRCVLDRVFILASLVLAFPLCTLVAETNLGSDHTPLIMDTGEGSPTRSNRFFFESGWFEIPGFQDLMLAAWGKLANTVGGRQTLRGWSHNLGKEARLKKDNLLNLIKNIDAQADSSGLDDDEWAYRYHLEEHLLQLYKVEEEYWCQRGMIRWALQGDANTAIFMRW